MADSNEVLQILVKKRDKLDYHEGIILTPMRLVGHWLTIFIYEVETDTEHREQRNQCFWTILNFGDCIIDRTAGI